MFDVMFDRLDNHDGVIDDKTNRQHETKERERVHGESEHWKQRERAHQGNWNSEQRDQSCAPALQENENDHDDEKERFHQRVLDLDHSLRHRERRVETNHVIEIGWKFLR